MLRETVLLALVASASAQDCFTDPAQDSCKDALKFYPKADMDADLAALCGTTVGSGGAMSWMPGCSVRQTCIAKGMLSSDYCDSFSILANICSTGNGEMMTGMAGCKKYVQLCGADATGTKVEACTSKAAIKNLPTTADALKYAVEGCDTHKESDGCKNNACMAGAPSVSCRDPFSAIYKSCKEDKTRAVCTKSSWTTMCQAVGTNIKEFCGDGWTTASSASSLSIPASLIAFFSAFAVIRAAV